MRRLLVILVVFLDHSDVPLSEMISLRSVIGILTGTKIDTPRFDFIDNM
jgi:hypothetical protein